MQRHQTRREDLLLTSSPPLPILFRLNITNFVILHRDELHYSVKMDRTHRMSEPPGWPCDGATRLPAAPTSSTDGKPAAVNATRLDSVTHEEDLPAAEITLHRIAGRSVRWPVALHGRSASDRLAEDDTAQSAATLLAEPHACKEFSSCCPTLHARERCIWLPRAWIPPPT